MEPDGKREPLRLPREPPLFFFSRRAGSPRRSVVCRTQHRPIRKQGRCFLYPRPRRMKRGRGRIPCRGVPHCTPWPLWVSERHPCPWLSGRFQMSPAGGRCAHIFGPKTSVRAPPGAFYDNAVPYVPLIDAYHVGDDFMLGEANRCAVCLSLLRAHP